MNPRCNTIAICYDFDGTLALGNMQEYDFIPSLKMRDIEFWQEVESFAKNNKADCILSYMYLMLKKAKEKKIPICKEDFKNYGKKIVLFAGVSDFFNRINEFASLYNIKLKHYIISSGLKEMIKGTSIAHEFNKIYASGFCYDEKNQAVWPSLAINYTTKTQYLFRINKGSFDVYDNSIINKFVPHKKRKVPFSNMVFIGDGETDIPCMRLIKAQGGHAIAVYNPKDSEQKKRAQEIITDGRANLLAPADYCENSIIDKTIKAIIKKIAINLELSDLSAKQNEKNN